MNSLPGLERVLSVCGRLNLSVKTRPPSISPPAPGTLVNGQPLDPLLARFYTRLSEARFATDRAGLIIDPFEEGEESSMVKDNQHWSDLLQQMALPLVVFGAEPLTVYRYALVPSMADEQGRQPVVYVDFYEEPHALPVASNLDQLLDLYARYLEELVVAPGYEEDWESALVFPWAVPHLVAQDRRLVQMIRAGAFDSLMKKTGSTPDWIASVMEVAEGQVH